MILSNKIICITGGTGFIGNKIIEKFKDNNQIRVLSRKKYISTTEVEYFNGDLTKQNYNNLLKNFTNDADILFHCASDLFDETKMKKLHIDGTNRLIESCLGKKIKWIQLSSVGAFGHYRKAIVDEFTDEHPNNLYEETKVKSDRLIKESGLNFTILRPSIVFGKDMKSNLLKDLSTIIKKKLFFFIGKNSLMNLVHINDVVNALYLCACNEKSSRNTYILSQNIELREFIRSLCNGMKIPEPQICLPELPIRYLTKILENIPNFPLTSKKIDVLTRRCFFDSSKIERELGFSFSLNLPDQIKEYGQSI